MVIVLLDTRTVNRIAAGEVINGPANIVKELVENAIDAGSSKIEIKVESGGRNLIIVTDDGDGIEKSDLKLAFMRYATSKLNDSELVEIRYLGFRGEALPSIAAVSRVRLLSRARGRNEAWSISYEGGGEIIEITPCSLPQGTQVEVRDLFFSTPNRLKFLKTERAEIQSIIDIVNNLAMINYHIGFHLSSDNKKLLKYVKQASLFNRLCEIEEKFRGNTLEIDEERDGIRLTGYVCKPTINYGKSTMIYTFVNGRPIKDNLLIAAIRYAYHDFIPNDRYPFVVLNLGVPYDQVDVNVHPNKLEVRFQNKRVIYEIVTKELVKALSTRIGVSNIISGYDTEIYTRFQHSVASITNGFVRNILPSAASDVRKGLYGKKPKRFGNCLVEVFNLSNREKKSLSEQRERSESFDCASVQKSLLQTKNVVLEGEQINLIGYYPLGFARCQVYNIYIIAEAQDKLIIVDQHAAHERLIYECLKQRSRIKRQELLFPETIEIKNQVGMEMIEAYNDKLFEMGFCIEIRSKNEIVVREIPAILGKIDVKEMLINIIDRLIEMEDTLPIEEKVNRILATIACYKSIRSGREMKLEEMNMLLRQMEETPYSGQCNHGRPTYIEIKLSDIEKLFGRR
ncbi:DNA mismatch repair endonuclease MutL [Wolbachia endosymbiont of Dipetalonema caudispina]|uniref:DNA mismatch repair endonuclease MutL n=1 Tax=Wolbachia endosymbiont of Dipetalonema caudispina TaxID=1812112 RepID=UPI00158F0873|nr:DNA mismatch repair endonuclease MutL [Wolbachia endosymbiont of Dipetalonema caudispina]QKX00896.1 DNA mismatch repair endonuclease MutL [Wolbachia endosymbiont of Dipetalonema caudispina]